MASVAAPVPKDLPAIAFRQAGIYRLEVALLVVYGGLLFVTPAFAGLIRGRLPIEISTHGARFAEEAEWSEDLISAKIDGLEKATDALAENLVTARSEIEQLRATMGDSSQQGVGSAR